MISFTPNKLPEFLLSRGFISDEQIKLIDDEVQRSNQTYDEALLKLKILSKVDLLKVKAALFGVDWIDLEQVDVTPELAQIIPASMARRYLLLCLEKKDKTLKVAMANPADVFAVDDIRLRTGLQVIPVLASKEELEKAIKSAYKGEGWEDIVQQVKSDFSVSSVEEEIEEDVVIDAPVVRLVDNILSEAVAQGASDVHIEPFQKEVRVRYRVDGKLQEIMSPPKNIYNAMVSRIKIMADLDIAERRIPQDGRIRMEAEGRQLDLRVSTLPTMGGESVVMRLLDSKSLRLNLADLFTEELLKKFKSAVTKPNGIVLVTGPTGSGKSTTLYATIASLNTPSVKILTVEDPVEYYLRGVNQVQCKPKAGLTFAAALKSFLRQDPDIILVGEIRDYETGEIAIEAALTGHMVLSTLHTNDAIASITRLVDMGIEPFLIATSLNAVLAQRLVRTICPSCKEPDTEPSSELLEQLNAAGFEGKDISIMRGKGCKTCYNSGYKGRIGLYEIMIADDKVKKMIANKATNLEIFDYVRTQGFETLRENGLRRIAEGKTTYEEILRVTTE